jgi:anti-sigma factor RsiW
MNAPHADLATLLAYWLGELDESAEAGLETHYLGCDECAARLSEVEALASGIRRLFGEGASPRSSPRPSRSGCASGACASASTASPATAA